MWPSLPSVLVILFLITQSHIISSWNDIISNARSNGICYLPKTEYDNDNDGDNSASTDSSNDEEDVDDQLPCACREMVPRKMKFPPQTSPGPWQIHPNKYTLRQHYSQTITLGSSNASNVFLNYVVTAKSVNDGHIVGHFEYQWDAIAVCCYEPKRNYSYEGKRLHPNLLVGSQSIRVPKANQTVVWTAPRHFEGPVVFVATFWKSGKLYWPNVTSKPIEVVRRNLTRDNIIT